MATLLHVTGEGQQPLPPFAGHLVRNLEWHRYSPEAVDSAVDTVVASPSSPAEAVQLVVDLREAGREQAVVFLADGSPGWRSVGGAFEAVSVVEGLDGLRRLLEESHQPAPADPPVSAGADDDAARRHVPRGGSRGLLLERLGDLAGRLGQQDDPAVWASLASDSTEAGGPDELGQGEGDGPETGGPDGAGRPDERTGVLDVEGTRLRSDPPLPRQGPPPSGPGLPAATERVPRRQRRQDGDPDRLVEALLEVTERLYGVRETGTAVAGHVRDVVGVDAVAVLLPDGAVWAVVGAVGHRHLEERLLLGGEHWLVREVTQGRHGVIVEDTDIARSRLAGAPLTAWRHLLACPVPAVDGLVLMARSDSGPAFTSRDLAHASRALAEAGPLFASALAVRELARRLRRHAELEDPLD